MPFFFDPETYEGTAVTEQNRSTVEEINSLVARVNEIAHQPDAEKRLMNPDDPYVQELRTLYTQLCTVTQPDGAT